MSEFFLGLILLIAVFFVVLHMGLSFSLGRTGEKHVRLHDGRTVVCIYSVVSGSISCDWQHAGAVR